MGFLSGALEGFGDKLSGKKKSEDDGVKKPASTKDTDPGSIVEKAVDFIKKRRQRKKDREMELPVNTRSNSGELQPLKPVPEYKRGGKVRKTGKAKLHAGEKVVPKKRR